MEGKNCFIFDLDGTIVDSQVPFHSYVESELLRIHHGIKISPVDIAVNYAGVATRTVLKELAPKCDVEYLVQKKFKNMPILAEKHKVKCLPQMYELVLEMKKAGNEFAIASSSPTVWIDACLDFGRPPGVSRTMTYSLRELFEGKYFSGNKTVDGQPVPDVFLKAAETFANKGNIYVIGDTRMDVLAGLSANMKVLYISRNDRKFDHDTRVARFVDTIDLATHVRTYLI